MGAKTKTTSGKWIAAGLVAAAATTAGVLAVWGIYMPDGAVPRRERVDIPHAATRPSPAGEGRKTSQGTQEETSGPSEVRTREDLEKAMARARASGEPYTITCAGSGPRSATQVARAKLDQFKAHVAVVEGREYEAVGRLEFARFWFQAALALDKDNKDAAVELAILGPGRLVTEAAGDESFAMGKWAEALEAYLKIDPGCMDDTLAAKIVECRFRIALAKSDQLRAEGKGDEADKAIQEALTIKPSAKDLLDTRGGKAPNYKKLMPDGDEAMKREQWGTARRLFLNAQKIRDTVAVKNAIAEVGYQENMAKGQDAIGQGQFDLAMAHFRLAMRFKDTVEVRRLLGIRHEVGAFPNGGTASPAMAPATTSPGQGPGR